MCSLHAALNVAAALLVLSAAGHRAIVNSDGTIAKSPKTQMSISMGYAKVGGTPLTADNLNSVVELPKLLHGDVAFLFLGELESMGHASPTRGRKPIKKDKSETLLATIRSKAPDYHVHMVMTPVNAGRQSGAFVFYRRKKFTLTMEKTFVSKDKSAKGIFGCRLSSKGVMPQMDFWLLGVDSPTDFDGKQQIANEIRGLTGHDKVFAIGDFNNRLTFPQNDAFFKELTSPMLKVPGKAQTYLTKKLSDSKEAGNGIQKFLTTLMSYDKLLAPQRDDAASFEPVAEFLRTVDPISEGSVQPPTYKLSASKRGCEEDISNSLFKRCAETSADDCQRYIEEEKKAQQKMKPLTNTSSDEYKALEQKFKTVAWCRRECATRGHGNKGESWQEMQVGWLDTAAYSKDMEGIVSIARYYQPPCRLNDHANIQVDFQVRGRDA